jgi:hypothetical protein
MARIAGTMPARALIALAAATIVHGACGAQAIPAGAQRIPPERLAHYWLLIPESAQANVPNSGYGLDAPTCVAVSYVIEKNGTTSHVKLERVVPPGLLGKVARNVVAGMRFAPAPQNLGKNPVHTYVVMPFNLPDPNSGSAADRAERARVLEPCRLPDFLPATK